MLQDQNKFRLQLVKSGIPSFRMDRLDSDGNRIRPKTPNSDEGKAKEDIAQILEKYAFRKSYLQKQIEQEACF